VPGRRRAAVRAAPTAAGLLLLCLVALLALAMASAATPTPPPVGDWVVDSDTTLSNATLTVNGSLLVSNASTLVLDHTVLRFAPVGGGAAWINVSSGSALRLESVDVGAWDNGTVLGGALEGSLTASNSTLRDLRATHPSGDVGLHLDGAQVALFNVTIIDCDAAFSGPAAGFSANVSVVQSCDRSLYLGAGAFPEGLSLTLRGLLVLDTPSVVVLACAPCAQDLSIDLEALDLWGSPRPSEPLVNISGEASWTSVSIRASRLLFREADRTVLRLDGTGGGPWVTGALALSISNTTLFGDHCSLASMVAPNVTTLQITIEDTDASCMSADSVYGLHAGATLSSADARVVRSNLAATGLYLAPGDAAVTFRLSVEDSTVRGLRVTGNFSPGSSVDVTGSVVDGVTPFPSGAALFALYGEPTSPAVRVRVTGSAFLHSGFLSTGPVDLRIVGCHFSDSAQAVRVALGALPPPGPSHHTLVSVEDSTVADVFQFVNVTSPLSILPAEPVAVRLLNITATRTESVVNITAASAYLVELFNVTASGTGQSTAVAAIYARTLNVSIIQSSFENHRVGVHLNRSFASQLPDRWDFATMEIRNVSVGMWLRTNHLFDANVTVDASFFNASQRGLVFERLRANVSTSTIEGPPVPVAVTDVEVTLYRTAHYTWSVAATFTAGVGFVEAWIDYSGQFVWAGTGQPLSGWHVVGTAFSDHVVFDLDLDAEGRPYGSTRLFRVYSFNGTYDHFDARVVSCVLTTPGRTPTRAYHNITDNGVGVQAVVADRTGARRTGAPRQPDARAVYGLPVGPGDGP
jgi:hypothetical protein